MTLTKLQQRAIQALRWSEKYTKTDMVYLISRSGLGLMGQIITSLAALVFAIVVGHYVPQVVYGEYKYVLAIIALLSLFSLNSIGGAVFQSTAQGYSSALTKGFLANIRWSFAVFAGALVMAVYYFTLGQSTLAAEILIGGCLSPFVASANLYSSFLVGKKEFIRQMIYGTLDNVVTIVAMIITVLLTHNPVVLVAVYFGANLLAALFFYRKTLQLYPPPKVERHDEGLVTYSKHLSALGILGGIADALDEILTFHFLGAAPVALFVFARALPDQLRTPTKNLDTMLQARFVGRSSSEIAHSMRNKFFWYFICSLMTIVVFILLAPFIFKIFFPAYMGSVLYAQIYMVGFIAITFDPANAYLASRKKVKEFYINSLVSSIIQIIGMIIAVIYWGILGLIVVEVLVRIGSMILAYFLYRNAIKRDIANAQTYA